ncbi:MAG: hypothetical protein ACMXYM_01940 [Candidatus Woesearchaeota archaeon]
MRLIHVLPFIALAIAFVMLAWGVQDTEVVSYMITNVAIDEGLVIEGVLTLDNPGRIPVPVQRVTYEVATDAGVIAHGELDGWLLRPGTSDTQMKITLTSESVLTALRTTGDEITVSGDIHVLWGTLPFSDSYTVRDAIRTLVDTIGGPV